MRTDEGEGNLTRVEYNVDQNGNVLNSFTSREYDARLRPWYQLAVVIQLIFKVFI